MVKKRSLRFICCHEAGHAVAAHLNNYQISLIQISESAHQVCDDPDLGSFVKYVPQEWECFNCGRKAVDRHNPTQLSELLDDCTVCKEEKARFIERCFAGCVATELLEPSEHDKGDERDCEMDMTQIGAVYPTRSQARIDAFRIGRERATAQICQSRDAVIALRDQLLLKQVMSGTEAVAIISAALVAIATDNGK